MSNMSVSLVIDRQPLNPGSSRWSVQSPARLCNRPSSCWSSLVQLLYTGCGFSDEVTTVPSPVKGSVDFANQCCDWLLPNISITH